MTMPDRNSKPATIKTILVLDDDVLVRKPVVQLLRECGYRSDAWRTRTAHSMTIRGPDSPGSTPRSGRAYPGGRGPAWSARAFEAIILAIVAVALVIWFALGG